MFREMRRKNQQLPKEEVEVILKNETEGVLAVTGDNGYPYAVPLNYVYRDGKLYFHGAKSGHKLDAVQRNPKASFCIISKKDIVAEELTTYFESVIAFGTIRILEGEELKQAVYHLGMKYLPNPEAVEKEIAGTIKALSCMEMTIDHVTGKEAIERTRMRS